MEEIYVIVGRKFISKTQMFLSVFISLLSFCVSHFHCTS